MNITNMYEAKTNFSKLIAQVEQGQEMFIGRRGQPIAKIVPINKPKKRLLGLHKDEIKVKPDWNSDETNKMIADMFYS